MTLILSGTDGVSDVDGTAAAPAVRGSDINTGMFFPAADTIAFAEGGVEVMRLTAAGRLGIGVTNPEGLIEAGGPASGAAATILVGNAAVAARVGVDSSNHVQLATGQDVPIKFLTLNTERARFTSDGNLLVGQTAQTELERLGVTFTGNNNGGYFYNVSANPTGSSIFVNFGNATGTNNTSCNFFRGRSAGDNRIFIYGNGNIQNSNNSYGGISDVKLKENIVDATPKLEKLNQVRVVNYNMIGSEQKHIGVVAQEVEQIFPGIVEETPDRDAEGNDLGTVTKGVKYSVFVPMLIKAIQEQQAIITELTARVAALELK